MKKDPCWLSEFRQDTYSQTGEDGVLEKILTTLPVKDNWCVEFGAWDGQHLSNTKKLVKDSGYSSILIEGDASKFENLKDYYSGNSKVITLNRYVGFEDHNSLDCILADTPITVDFDLLSIDIDGNDYHVWKALKKYQPKVVIIEFNPTIPTEASFIQPADSTICQGSSLLSLVDLAKSKGYSLICVLPFNAIFVKSELFDLFEIEDNNPKILRTDFSNVTYIFSGYDGSIFLDGYKKLPWHGVSLSQEKLQVLPRYLRKHPHYYNKLQKVVFNILTCPIQCIKKHFFH